MTSQRRRLRGPVRVVLSQTGPPRSGIRDARRPGGGDGGLCGDEFELRPAGFLVAMVSEDESKLWTERVHGAMVAAPLVDGAQWHLELPAAMHATVAIRGSCLATSSDLKLL